MKRSMFIAIFASSALLFVGCAKKEVEVKKASVGESKGYVDNQIKTEMASNIDNVDKYGGNSRGYSYDKDYDSSSDGLTNIYFDVDKYMITPDKLSIISSNAKVLEKGLESGSKVKIEGNCDATGTDEYNYALGLKRAKATKEALVSKGIKPSKILLVSLGESSPECTTDVSSECYAKNRRVEFKILR
jgi:peptidoglycan-associated lipoprotein